jgi:hypothetical protein
MLVPKSTTPSKSRCWPPVPLLPPAKLWTLQRHDSSKREPIVMITPLRSDDLFLFLFLSPTTSFVYDTKAAEA